MDDSYANGDPETGGNPDAMQEPTGRCIKLYVGSDGSMTVSESAEAAPEDGEPVASLDEALEAIRMKVDAAPAEDEMQGARRGYERMAKPKPAGGGMPMGAVFGEG
jgi:hypothetical protein